jgi:hypothetical protein
MVSINELVDIVEKIAGLKVRRKYNLDAPKGVRGRNSNNDRIQELLGWAPSIRLEERDREDLRVDPRRDQARGGLEGVLAVRMADRRASRSGSPAGWEISCSNTRRLGGSRSTTACHSCLDHLSDFRATSTSASSCSATSTSARATSSR